MVLDAPHIPQAHRETLAIPSPYFEVTKIHVENLYAATLWHNGATFIRDDQAYRIGLTPPPDFQTLLDVKDKYWYLYHKHALDDLQSAGYLEDVTILRRSVSYCLTNSGQQKANELFFKAIDIEDRIPDELHDHINDGEAIVGDRYGKLKHRTMIETAAYAYGEFSDALPQRYTITRYPTNPDGPSADLKSTMLLTYESRKYRTILVEAFTDHNDTNMTARKYDYFSNADPEVIIIGENAPHITRILNRLHEDPDITCHLPNFPIDNPANYRLPIIQEYLQRAHNSPDYAAPGIDEVTTLTTLYRDHLPDKAIKNKQRQLLIEDNIVT